MTRSERNKDYYMKNRTKILAYKKFQRLVDPQKYQRATKKWRLKNPEKVIAISAKERLLNGPKLMARTKAWFARNPERSAYYNMRQRCYNPKSINYKNYGGRGIRVKYKNFYAFLADVGVRPNALFSIDRINNNGHYEPSNCKWSTPSEQAYNRRKKTLTGVEKGGILVKGTL